ncbi:hypothetical protein MMC26_003839 [Xylographa opegraphella]|nr:hypothetical protein [Xylographa opegraphella]
MANGWSIIIGLTVVVVASLLAWFFAPKGENQTYVQGSSPPINMDPHQSAFSSQHHDCPSQRLPFLKSPVTASLHIKDI